MTAIVHRPGEGERIEVGGSGLSFKLTDQDGGPLSFAESTVAPGFPGPPLHLHREMYDIFFVLEGTLTLQLDDETGEAAPGTFVAVEPGTPHTFSNPSEETVKVLNINSPAGFEGYLRGLAAAMGRNGEMPAPEKVAEIASDYDFELVPPPSGD